MWGKTVVKAVFRFLGWIDRNPDQMWPFPFAGVEPRKKEKTILVDREGVAYLPTRKVVLKGRKDTP